ncbi:MAG TPA: family 43 glycosylhydrolase [Fimbriimonadaceae bacterium]
MFFLRVSNAFANGPATASLTKSPLLDLSRYKHYFAEFAQENPTIETASGVNEWAFFQANIPWFDCPDKQLEKTYYYRWWTFQKHLKLTPDGWIVTEFLPSVPWAGIYNTIPCAAGHHIYEGRWLRDPQYMADYARFWTFPEAAPRSYSFWFADSVLALTSVTGNLSLAQELLPNLVANYKAWERTNQDASGLFKQIDDRDGMEYSLGGSGYRPTINSYIFGDAQAIAALASAMGQTKLAQEFQTKATRIKKLVESNLWNPSSQFFETCMRAASGVKSCGVQEEIGYIPWYFNLPSNGYEAAWKQLVDPSGFAAPFGPTTAERRAAGFMGAQNHDCLWNGPSWPYATTQTLVACANLLDNYSQSVITKKNYFDLLLQYARSQEKNGRPWIAEDLDSDSGKWIVDLPRSVAYNHSGFDDLVISGLVGIRPRLDNRVVVKPLVPAGEWPWFCLDDVPYHGHTLSVMWDADGSHYGKGSGFTLYLDNVKVAHRADLGELNASLQANTALPIKGSHWDKYAENPVLGGKLGTCFDLSVLNDGGLYKMFFSWRPERSIAAAESKDGIHWSEPKIVLGPAETGWEDEVNRPSVLKKDDVYYMWYTGQFQGRTSAIGYATSKDGIHWQRKSTPVLKPDQTWEKVAVMCPSVLWDESEHQFRMWYSGGDQYEPDAIGYAVSADGVHWTKRPAPIFKADANSWWEKFKVTACQVLVSQGWHYMFYVGFRDIDHAQIGIARSKDGISNWERLKMNPILSPTIDSWDADACYKPFALYDERTRRWNLWYNGRRGGLEQIGLATKQTRILGF